MSNEYFQNDEETANSSIQSEQNMALRPPDDDGDPPIDPPYSVGLNQVSPIAGSVAGGISVTLTGSGFQPGAAVYFGNSPATQVSVESGEVIRAVVPASSSGAGSVSVSVINPDGTSATLSGGFTYVESESGEQAEVIGVTPLAVVEDTNTVVTIRGRNLIEAYNRGVLALRGPSRCQITFLGTITSHDAASGIDTVQMNVNIKCSPALAPLERMAIQVLASRRPEAANDGVVESSRQMFTVLPKAVPVSLAYTANLQAGQPNLVMISGRNLDGHSLSLNDGTEVAFQKNDGNFISGIVTLPENVDTSAPLQLSMLDSGGTKVAEYQMEVAPDSGFAKQSFEQSYASLAPNNDELALNLTPAPNQQFIGPTANDSAAFSVQSGSPFGFGFNWWNFEITIIDVTIILPIVNEVYLIPFFDGGGNTLNSPVVAEVGKIFRLRGAGLLVAIRVEVQIHIQVVLIIGFYYQIWDYGFYNEFPQYGWSIGSVVIGIRVEIQVIFYLSAMAAIVLPNGQLRVIAAVNLTLGIDFSIDSNGHLHFDPIFTHAVRLIGITPMPNNLQPCGGKFQLVSDDNGRTAFLDSQGGYESYYFVREAGECCVPWDFNMQLVRFSSTGQQEVIQSEFQASYCVTATESPVQYDVVITSEPPPTGIPPTLVMDIGDTATLKALAVPVDSNGNPTGAPAQDLRDLGYGVDFFLALPTDQVLDPTTLPPGRADAILQGSNLIRAAVTSVRVLDDEPALAFWRGSIHGFRRSPSAGEEPRLVAGGLPVTVNADAAAITVEPVLAYEEMRNGQRVLVPAPNFQNNFSTPAKIWEQERNEPFEAQRELVLAVKINVPPNVTLPNDTKLTLRVDKAMALELFKRTDSTSSPGSPLSVFGGDRSSRKPEDFFTGDLLVPSSAPAGTYITRTITLPNRVIAPDELFKVIEGTSYLGIKPNVVESNVTGPDKRLVPPGEKVTGQNVLLKIPLTCSANNGVTVSFRMPVLNIVPTNDETFEEYLRVFQQVQPILVGAGAYFKNFADELLKALVRTTDRGAELKSQGETLWRNGCDLVQSGSRLDDRPLYWARLQGIGAIRAFAKRNVGVVGGNFVESNLSKFEYPSRGLDVDGGIKFPATVPAGARKAILTGFDPFELSYGLDPQSGRDSVETSNPSGLLALNFNGKLIDVPNQESVYVRTAVFPVRYEDFNKRLIEKAITPSLNSIIMLVTTSQNGSANYYDLERWAARFRVNGIDNDNQRGGAMPSDPAGAEYLESTLPFDSVVTSAEQIEGPRGMAPLVIDQSYKSVGSSRLRSERRNAPASPPTYDPSVESGRFRPEPLLSDADGHRRVGDSPQSASLEGSGGNYLSNEIFYRTALVRNALKRTLASGHFHVPPTGYEPDAPSVGGQLIAGVTKVVRRLFRYGFRLAGPTSIAFPQTVINTTAEQMLTVTNNSTEPIKIGSIDSAAPFSVVLPSSLPITINPGASLTLRVAFTPTIAGSHTGRLILRETSGEIILIVDTSGDAIENLPSPVISWFSPQTVFAGESVSIYGQNFFDVTGVTIGGNPIGYYVASDTEIYTDPVMNGGFITVFTNYGSATSDTTLFVRSWWGGEY
jgi:pyrrolidone-carboxylate peptidase